MKTTRGLAAAAAIAALAISTAAGGFSNGRDDQNLYPMRESMLDVRDGRASLSELAGSLPAIPERLLLGADETRDVAEPVEELAPELATPSPTATIAAPKQEPAPTPIPEPQSLTKAPENDAIFDTLRAAFVQGWTAGGGDAVTLRLVLCIQGKESGGDPLAYNTAGPFYGLMQFAGPTWDAMGGGDWRDPYQQGVNTAKLWRAASPANQWPVAYRLCVFGA